MTKVEKELARLIDQSAWAEQACDLSEIVVVPAYYSDGSGHTELKFF